MHLSFKETRVAYLVRVLQILIKIVASHHDFFSHHCDPPAEGIMVFVFALDEQLQFIFRHIDHKDPDKPYVCTFSINEQGDYEGM